MKTECSHHFFLALFFSCLASLLAGCGNDGNKDLHDHPQLTTGKQLFEYHCSGCHKPTGKGNFLQGIPPSKGVHLNASQIAHKISGDRGSAKMPTFPNMPEAEKIKITQYLKSL